MWVVSGLLLIRKCPDRRCYRGLQGSSASHSTERSARPQKATPAGLYLLLLLLQLLLLSWPNLSEASCAHCCSIETSPILEINDNKWPLKISQKRAPVQSTIWERLCGVSCSAGLLCSRPASFRAQNIFPSKWRMILLKQPSHKYKCPTELSCLVVLKPLQRFCI